MGPGQGVVIFKTNFFGGNLKKWTRTCFQKIKILKIKIRVAQNVGKVQISRTKQLPAHLGPFEDIFSMDQANVNNVYVFTIFLGGPMGPIDPLQGKCLQ